MKLNREYKQQAVTTAEKNVLCCCAKKKKKTQRNNKETVTKDLFLFGYFCKSYEPE